MCTRKINGSEIYTLKKKREKTEFASLEIKKTQDERNVECNGGFQIFENQTNMSGIKVSHR